MIDVLNENQEYWEKILSDCNLSEDRESLQTIEITPEEYVEIINVDLLPEEEYEKEDEPVIRYNGITKDTDSLNIDHSGLYETFEEMLTKFDKNDPFFRGHSIIKPHRGDTAKKTGIPRKCPDWALNNEKIRRVLLQSFPKLTTNSKQRFDAGRWVRIIQMYFKSQMTHGQIAKELNCSVNKVKMAVRTIKYAFKGRTKHGKKRTGSRGRPK